MDIETTCPDCEQDPCLCAEWEEQFQAAQAEEAERAAIFAETMIQELWVDGPQGLLVRRKR